jgi:hypothetical protein
MSFIFSPLLVPSVHDSASSESDGEFQDSFEQQVSDLEDTINDIPDDSDEIQDLQRLKTECRKVELPKIHWEKLSRSHRLLKNCWQNHLLGFYMT